MRRPHWVEWFMLVASLNLMACEQPVNDLHPEAHSFGGASAPRTEFPPKPDETVPEEAFDEASESASQDGEFEVSDEAFSCTSALDCAIPPSLGSCLEVVCEEGACIVAPAGDGETCTTPDFEKNLCVLQSVCNSGKCVLVEEVQCPETRNCESSQCDPGTGNAPSFPSPTVPPAPSCSYDADCLGAIELEPVRQPTVSRESVRLSPQRTRVFVFSNNGREVPALSVGTAVRAPVSRP